MDPKLFQSLNEAYQQVYLDQEETEQLDEISADLALRASKAADIKRGKLSVAKDKEGAAKKAAQASRLYAKQTKIRLNKEEIEIEEASYSAKAARAGKDIGKPGKQFAKIAASAAKRYGSKERGEKVAGAVLAKLRKEELDIFDVVLEFLQVEGYAETLEEAEWLMANELDAEDIDAILDEAEIMKHQQQRDRIERSKASEADRVKKARSAYGKLSQYSPPTKGVHGEIERRQAQRPPSKLRSGSLPEEYVDEDAAYDRNRKRAAQRAQARNEARARGQTGSVPGVGYVSPRPERATYTDSAGVVRHHTGGRMPK